MITLYRKNNQGKPCFWNIEQINTNSYFVEFGLVNGEKSIKELINCSRLASEEIKSKINDKRKQGYKYVEELRDNNELPVKEALYNYLLTYLPDDRTSADGNLLPMLAKVFDTDNTFNKCSDYYGQYKINGLRCCITASKNDGDMFKPYKLKFRSREGTYWTSLGILEEKLLSILSDDFIGMMIEQGFGLDGEVYIPGKSVNEINSAVKNVNNPDNKNVQFWLYDIAVNNISQTKRVNFILDNFYRYVKEFNDRNEHLNNKETLVVLPSYHIQGTSDAVYNRDKFIDLGFEGLILRNPDEEYQFGKRNKAMWKFKKSTDGKFKIIDIKPEGLKRSNIPLFTCKNDINDCTFECHMGGTFDAQEFVLKNKEKFIGQYMYVEFGERSGVNRLPFHIKATYIIPEM